MSKPTRLQLIPERATYSTVVNYYDAAEMDAWLTDTVLPVLEDAGRCIRTGFDTSVALDIGALIKELKSE